MAGLCNQTVVAATADVLNSIRAGKCPTSYALRVDKLLDKCHGKVSATIANRANHALNEYEAKCGAYTSKYSTERPYQVDGARPRRRRRRKSRR